MKLKRGETSPGKEAEVSFGEAGELHMESPGHQDRLSLSLPAGHENEEQVRSPHSHCGVLHVCPCIERWA